MHLRLYRRSCQYSSLLRIPALFPHPPSHCLMFRVGREPQDVEIHACNLMIYQNCAGRNCLCSLQNWRTSSISFISSSSSSFRTTRREVRDLNRLPPQYVKFFVLIFSSSFLHLSLFVGTYNPLSPVLFYVELQ